MIDNVKRSQPPQTRRWMRHGISVRNLQRWWRIFAETPQFRIYTLKQVLGLLPKQSGVIKSSRSRHVPLDLPTGS